MGVGEDFVKFDFFISFFLFVFLVVRIVEFHEILEVRVRVERERRDENDTVPFFISTRFRDDGEFRVGRVAPVGERPSRVGKRRQNISPSFFAASSSVSRSACSVV